MAIWIKDDPAKLLFIACMSDGEAAQKLKITGGTKLYWDNNKYGNMS